MVETRFRVSDKIVSVASSSSSAAAEDAGLFVISLPLLLKPWSLIIATVIILLYVAFRFEFVYGVSAIVALAHDVSMAFVIAVLVNKLGILNLELSVNSLAAYLTILGYSINDKVVVFDRIRENREKHRSMPLAGAGR
jgi:preprotein translocase SecF subunit